LFVHPPDQTCNRAIGTLACAVAVVEPVREAGGDVALPAYSVKIQCRSRHYVVADVDAHERLRSSIFLSCPSNIDYDEGASILEKSKRTSDALDNVGRQIKLVAD
jgi:hypothetical protein